MKVTYTLQVLDTKSKTFDEKIYHDLRLVKKAYRKVRDAGLDAIVFKNGKRIFSSCHIVVMEVIEQ